MATPPENAPTAQQGVLKFHPSSSFVKMFKYSAAFIGFFMVLHIYIALTQSNIAWIVVVGALVFFLQMQWYIRNYKWQLSRTSSIYLEPDSNCIGQMLQGHFTVYGKFYSKTELYICCSPEKQRRGSSTFEYLWREPLPYTCHPSSSSQQIKFEIHLPEGLPSSDNVNWSIQLDCHLSTKTPYLSKPVMQLWEIYVGEKITQKDNEL